MKWPIPRNHPPRAVLTLLACGALPAAEQTDVESHLAACDQCRSAYRELAAICQGLRRWNETVPAIRPSAGFRARWTDAVKAMGPPAAFSLPSLAMEALTGWRVWLSGWRPASAGLAIVWLMILFFHSTAPDVPQAAVRLAPAGPRAIFLALRKQERMMSQWWEPFDPLPAEPANRSAAPRPRSERPVNEPPDPGVSPSQRTRRSA